MVLADKKDYKRGYEKHYRAFRRLKQTNDDARSRRLLLVYSVECGLKYKLLDNWHENNPKEILDNKDDWRRPIIATHNLEKILKELGQTSVFKFPAAIETKHGDFVNSEDFHQFCRYGVEAKNKSDKEEKYEEELMKVADWLEEELNQ